MGQQIVHRLLISFPALLGVLFLCFCLLQVVPADPAMIIAGPDAKAETIAAIRLELGLDRPIPVQFFEYILRVAAGRSRPLDHFQQDGQRGTGETIGPTVELMLGAMLIAVPIGPRCWERWRRSIAAARRSRHHGLLGGRRVDAGVLHRPDPDPVCRLQVGLLPFTGRTGPVWDGGLPA